MTGKLQQRDPSIDLLRFIGLTMIILAHIGLSRSTSLLFQLRSFDVPLMVFTSGLAFSGKNVGSYLPFIGKRTLRLIVPVYIFVAAYILLNPILSGWGLVENYSAEKIAGTFMLRLNPSIGYVWIIRVFLIVMLVTPLLIRLDKALKNDWVCLGAIAAVLAAQHLLVGWLKPMKPDWFIQDWVLYICGYSAAFMWGLRARKASPAASCVALLMLAAVLCFCGYGMYEEYGTLMKLQATKYPPQLYFLVWGMFISGILWFTRKWWTKVMDNRLFTFIGQNTIWIYLWHIPFVNIVVKGPFDAWHPLWKYIFVYVAALCIYALQYKIVGMVRKRWPNNVITKYFVG
mgnify:FL=1